MALLKAADSIVRTFQRTKLWREAPSQFKGQPVPSAVQELLSQPVLLPSPFLEQACQGFGAQVAEFKKTVAELEQVRGGWRVTAGLPVTAHPSGCGRL